MGAINVDSWVQGSMGWISSYFASAAAIGLRRDARPRAADPHKPAGSV